MKELINKFSSKIYYIVVLIVIANMMTGLFVDNPQFGEFDAKYIFHGILVFFLSVCLLLYPRKRTEALRITIIIVASIFIYTIFFLYPDTSSGFTLLCFIPAFSILFFDSKLFHFSLILNFVAITVIFGYIMIFDKGQKYSYIAEDLIGNISNFLVSQVIFYFIFYLTNERMKKQRIYYEQIQQSERLKTTGQLAAAVAHEIRNPLTVVKGFLQLFGQDSSLKEDQKRYYTLMIDELNMAEQVISQFLTMAKPDKEKITESVDVEVALQSVTDLLQSYGHIHDNTIDLQVSGACLISANLIEVKQLFINIIKNAIEATKTGDIVQVRAERENQFVIIDIIDHGEGMTEEEVTALGSPFYSLKSKGTGLGLMICFNIVEKYNGKIDFKTSKGHGTTVTIRFPAITPS